MGLTVFGTQPDVMAAGHNNTTADGDVGWRVADREGQEWGPPHWLVRVGKHHTAETAACRLRMVDA